ncbi:class I SAM-dependent methyltransferase [Gemelliphila palaticanis]|uniref:Class I SAM-dependent methyltransferase n=1 Tax=Gemelliphila palaticanis TaxID=81950 RepID=A0ABX2SYE3_9BACL|nr:class I SAM-dependent methyltransferase [Gemella palaticanis]MBF0714901.1 class I SAM-dependent methyltransferase [Gemella palaticanis]NYS46831.1 class I SAM-dependent methyltransferase [Gemella palaticanis]
MQHYYTSNPDIVSDKKIIESYISNDKYLFYTDNGVFSKGGVDFGTKSLLEVFSTDKDGAHVCDLGCGYGVVTVYLSKKYPNFKFTMIDVNNRALELSEDNIKLNNINSSIYLKENNGLDKIETNFDFIITNPPIRAGKKVVHKMITDSFDKLIIGGELWVVIQKKQGMASLKKLIFEIYGNVDVVSKNKGYYTLKSVKNN